MCWTCLSRWITAQLWPQWSSADTELCGKSAVRLMQQVRVYQSVLRKPQLAKCFTLRQSTENKAGRETYLCFHPFNYDSPTPPSPRTVPAGGCACGQRVAGSLLRWRTQPSPEVASRHLQVEPRPPPPCTVRGVYQNGIQSVKAHCPETGWRQRCCRQLPRKTPQKGFRPGLTL